jgi:hypothetical protein
VPDLLGLNLAPSKCFTISFLFFFLSAIWGLNSEPMLSRQEPYHLSHSLVPFCFFVHFADRDLHYCLGPALD